MVGLFIVFSALSTSGTYFIQSFVVPHGAAPASPEAIAFIVDEILEGARDGRTVADMIAFGSQILNSDDVLPGVAALMPMIQIEASFPDGTKLVTVHDPIRPGAGAQTEAAGTPRRQPTPHTIRGPFPLWECACV